MVTHLARVDLLAAEGIVVRPHFRGVVVDVLYSMEEKSLTGILGVVLPRFARVMPGALRD